MNNVGNILMQNDILLESGTNELEVLVFQVGGYDLGINVAKVREVLPAQEITRLPESHPSIVGCFSLRDQIVPCVSLHRHLEEETTKTTDQLRVILTEFNANQIAFIVDAVERIHRISWEKIHAAPSMMVNTTVPVTAVTNINDRLIMMLDFEMIADQISDSGREEEGVANLHSVPREKLRVILADDSVTVRLAAEQILRRSGYTDLVLFENGKLAWDYIQDRFD